MIENRIPVQQYVIWPVLVLFAGVGVLLVGLLAGSASARPPVQPQVSFIEPSDGATVATTFKVRLDAKGVKIEPAGVVRAGAGHLHILIDTPFIAAGQTIPQGGAYIHLGKGAREAELTLAPGEHVLRLQYANGAHIALDGEGYRATIKVTVKE